MSDPPANIRSGMGPRYSKEEAKEAIAASLSWSESLRRLNMCFSGGNWRTLKKYAEIWSISADHFDQAEAIRRGRRKTVTPIDEILREKSTYSRSSLKRRLIAEGLKAPQCELCGQGEAWRGKPMGLILDHINGVRDDNRLENLRIVCPNCAATFDTHCGRKNRLVPRQRVCTRCKTFRANDLRQRYCSRECGVKWDRSAIRGVPKPELRKVERPPFTQLMQEIDESNYLAVGRKYGVSDNAIRKWVHFYERQRERQEREAGLEAADDQAG